MNFDLTTAAPVDVPSLVTALTGTLQEELSALKEMTAILDEQAAALQGRRPEHLEEATLAATEQMSRLARLQSRREEQTRSLGRLLGLSAPLPAIAEIAAGLESRSLLQSAADSLRVLREQVRSTAGDVHRKLSVIEFAIQYAMQLGAQMIQAVHGAVDPSSGSVYTQRGHMAQSAGLRSYVNRVG